MKRIVSILLVLTLFVGMLSLTAFADSASEIDKAFQGIERFFEKATDNDVNVFFLGTLSVILKRDILTPSQADSILRSYKNTTLDNSTFGKGTFIVGSDLKAGTYDVVCVSTDQDDYSNSMNSFGDLYSQYGMQDFADAFGSLGNMADSMKSITITTYKTNGYRDKYYAIKPDESARVILTDGMSIEIEGGSARLVFVR